jgi:hypothetical protein
MFMVQEAEIGIVAGTFAAFVVQEAAHAALLPTLCARSAGWSPKKRAVWLNTASSLLHAAVCAAGVGACASGGGWRALVDAPLGAATAGSGAVIAFSLGYFAFDSFSMAAKGLFAGAPDMVAHHAVVALIQALALARGRFHPLVLAMLTAELNSVFLHARALLRATREQQDPALCSAAYRATRALLFASFVPCRFVAHGWVVYALWVARAEVGVPMWLVATAAALVVNLLNVQLFQQLLRAETPKKKKKQVEGNSKLADGKGK